MAPGAAAARTLIRGALVFDGIDADVRPLDVLVEGETILEVAPAIAAEAKVIDGTGRWLTPGLIDMHVHASIHGMEALPVFVGTGVTTVRDVGGSTARLRQMKLDVASGKVVGPEIVYSGPLLHEAPARPEDHQRGAAPGAAPFASAEQAAEAVERLIVDEGVGSLKIYESVGEPIAAAILEAVQGRVPVTGHLARTSSIFAMEHGIGGMEHLHSSLIRDLAPPGHRPGPGDWMGVPGYDVSVMRAWAAVDPAGPEVERWLKTFLEHRCFLTPTITVYSAWPAKDDPRLTLLPVATAATLRPRAAVLSNPAVPEDVTAAIRRNQRELMSLIHRHGGDLVAGTDFVPGKLPGWSLRTEMLAFQNRGLSPIEVLRAATSVPARHLHRDDLGVIAPGKRADLVLFAHDPTADIANLASITAVMRAGTLHDPAKLLAIAEPNIGKFSPENRI